MKPQTIDYYFLLFGEEQKGPFTESQVRNMWNSGAITATTFYRREGFTEWKPLSEIASLLEGKSSNNNSRRLLIIAGALAAVLALCAAGSALMYFGFHKAAEPSTAPDSSSETPAPPAAAQPQPAQVAATPEPTSIVVPPLTATETALADKDAVSANVLADACENPETFNLKYAHGPIKVFGYVSDIGNDFIWLGGNKRLNLYCYAWKYDEDQRSEGFSRLHRGQLVQIEGIVQEFQKPSLEEWALGKPKVSLKNCYSLRILR